MADIKLVKTNDWNPVGMRTKGQPNNKRSVEVLYDIKTLKLRKLIHLVKDRKAWNDLVQKTHTGLWYQKKKKRKKKKKKKKEENPS